MNDVRYRCAMCQGAGHVPEVGLLIDEPQLCSICLHCQGKGYVNFDTAHTDSVLSLIEAVSESVVINAKKSADESEDGEGWAFHAAENRMTEYDYTRSKVWGTVPLVEKELRKLSPVIVNALLRVVGIDMPLYSDPKKPEPVSKIEETDIEQPPF